MFQKRLSGQAENTIEELTERESSFEGLLSDRNELSGYYAKREVKVEELKRKRKSWRTLRKGPRSYGIL